MVLRPGVPVRHRLRDDSGAVAVLVGLFAVVMFGFSAIVVDLGIARDTSSDAQSAADAAALAAANVLAQPGGDLAPVAASAVSAAKEYAAANYDTTEQDWVTCEDPEALSYTYPSANTECISFDESVDPTTVRVRVPDRTVKSFFGGVVGYDGLTITASAEAGVDEGTQTPDCVFCVLGTGPHNVQDAEVEATGGSVRFNGNVNVGSSGHVESDARILVEGSVTSPGNFSPAAQQGAAHLDDPLAGMPLPVIPASHQIKTQPCGSSSSNGPGIYFNVTGYSFSCVLQPGLYVIAAPVDASVVVNATAGVTLYFVCKSGSTITPCSASTHPSDRGGLSVSGRMTVTAPSSGPTKGLALVYDRGNFSQLVPRDQDLTVTGTIYGASVTMAASSSDCATQNSLIVVRAITLSGNSSCLRTRYVAAQNVPEPLGADGVSLSR